MLMAERDVEGNLKWLVVGTRHDGHRVVLDEGHPTRGAAERRAELYREHLELYREIRVEHARGSRFKRGENDPLGDDDLGDSVARRPRNGGAG